MCVCVVFPEVPSKPRSVDPKDDFLTYMYVLCVCVLCICACVSESGIHVLYYTSEFRGSSPNRFRETHMGILETIKYI